MSHLLSKNYIFFENLVSWVLSFHVSTEKVRIYCQNRDSWLRLRINQRSVKSSQKISVFVWLSRERIYQLHPHHYFLFIFFWKREKDQLRNSTHINIWPQHSSQHMNNGKWFQKHFVILFFQIYKCTTSHSSHRASTFALVLSFHKK